MGTRITLLLILCLALTAARQQQPSTPFNGYDLKGWSFQKPKSQKPRWVVGSATLDPEDPRMFRVDPQGNQLINHVSSHGQGVDIYSDEDYADILLTLEVMVPRGSNSGIYLMGEYELQLLDSFGHEKNPGPGDMGAIYGARPPTNPVYHKPGEWSSFEIHFQAPRFDPTGKKTQNARFLKVILNGATIQKNVEINAPTPGGLTGKERPNGPILFQGNHGAVAFRNIQISPLPH